MTTAAIVTVGSELTTGLRLDTNTAEIARALAPRGCSVIEAISIADDVNVLAATLRRLCASCELVITTGGLGPTHDDVTRQAAADALGLELVRDERLVALLEPFVSRHRDPEAGRQLLVQAEVFKNARVIDPTTGTAPGLVVPTSAGRLVLLPGPPSEMRPMLREVVEELPRTAAEHHELAVTGMSESDVQVTAQRALGNYEGVGFTILAKPGDVRVLLLDDGGGAAVLAEAATAVTAVLGDAVYSADGRSLAQVVVVEAVDRGVRLATAESCTGGLVSAALTAVPGSSEAVCGGVVAYDNQVKIDLLGVGEATLGLHGAVSEQAACEMAQGARSRLGADIAVSITGVAGPGGGTDDKPVGLVWFAVANSRGVVAMRRLFPATGREAIRERATSVALDLLRRAVQAR
ncbi:MAG: competence/damage-inducible protein A [Actinobacteria bacterium HGW-Actinobacteria-7]|nr:MAG: competence/damage-inducible protein A [Actinobacteria bacterium HGW-Actinobacteria-7]